MKQTNNCLLFLSFFILIAFSSCKPKQVVSEEVIIETNSTCAYDTIQGRGIITKINLSNPENVVIKFRFEMPKGSNPKFPDLMMNEYVFNVDSVGQFPPKNWCDENGVEQGANFPCEMYELTDNSSRIKCEKIKFSFSEFKNKSWK